MTTRLIDLCSLIRSKNAGPFWLTFDFVARDQETYDRIAGSGAITPALFVELYGADPALTTVVHHPAAHAVKVSFPRPVRQGDLRDSDSYGGQFYAPLVDLEIG
jgi:hypothetical protein